MSADPPKWRIEVLSTSIPEEVWVGLNDGDADYTFPTSDSADRNMQTLLRSQGHLTGRLRVRRVV